MAKRDWSHVRAADRKRKVVQVTLSDEARERLRDLAKMHLSGTASGVVEDLVLGDHAIATVARELSRRAT